jgi:Na+(H+)/acetate symporter ActP
MKLLKALFSEDSSISMVRFMALLSLLIGGYLAIVGKDADVAIFVGAAFGAKITQKYIEVSKTSK